MIDLLHLDFSVLDEFHQTFFVLNLTLNQRLPTQSKFYIVEFNIGSLGIFPKAQNAAVTTYNQSTGAAT